MSKGVQVAAEAAMSMMEMMMDLPDAPDPFHLGLGNGASAETFVRKLRDLPKESFNRLCCVPASEATRRVAKEVGLALAEMDDLRQLHFTMDGADEIDPDLFLIKGGCGGSLLFEKILADRSDFFLIIVDESKVVDVLGHRPVPIEVSPYGTQSTLIEIMRAVTMMGFGGASAYARHMDRPSNTESGNLLFDLNVDRIESPRDLNMALSQIPGVVEHGLFCDYARLAIVGAEDGSLRMLGTEKLADGLDGGDALSNGQGDGSGPSDAIN